MDKKLFDYTAQKVEDLLAAASSSQKTRDAAQGWKDAIAAGEDADVATSKLLDIIDEHHTTIDEVLGLPLVLRRRFWAQRRQPQCWRRRQSARRREPSSAIAPRASQRKSCLPSMVAPSCKSVVQ